MDVNVLDLFCGAGGLSWGFHDRGCTVVCGIDNEGAFEETFTSNHGEHFKELDIGSEECHDYLRSVDADIVVGGPPCQGFSLAGKQDSTDDRNSLVTEFVRAVNIVSPRWFVMENVPRLLTMEDGRVRTYLHDQFESIGYTVSSFTLNSVNFGVPQTRERAFIVGNTMNMNVDQPSGSYRGDTSQRTFGDTQPPRTVGDAVGDLPSVDVGETEDEYTTSPTSEYQEWLRSDDCELRNHRAPNHGESVLNRIRGTEEGEKIPYESWSQKRRLDSEHPSPTLLAGPRPTYHFAHPTEDRGLTVRERARLQSFPDSFVFHGPVTKQRQMTGNAVPPLLSTALAELVCENDHLRD